MNNVNTKRMSNLVKMECPVCSVIYYADKTRLKHGRQTTCSRNCSYKHRADQLNKTKLFYCAVCNNKVYRSPAQVKSTFVFCSPQCHYKARSLGLVKRVVDSPYKITDEGRKSWKNAAEKRKGILYKDPISWICETCGKVSTIPRGKFAPSRKLRFCSPECANLCLAGENNPAWRGGHPDYYGPAWRPLRRKARELDNHTCQRCAITNKEYGKALDVHHIKPVSSFKTPNEANYIENLVSLCHDCHMLVEWNGIDFELPIRCQI